MAVASSFSDNFVMVRVDSFTSQKHVRTVYSSKKFFSKLWEIILLLNEAGN